jgi:hypothetical protein
MSGLFRTLGDVGTSKVGEGWVPDKVLGAMELTPVPMGAHNGADEGGVILMRSGVILEVTRLDVVGGRCDCRSSHKSNEAGNDPHGHLLMLKKLYGCSWSVKWEAR